PSDRDPCSRVWFVSFLFPAPDLADELLLWSTEPLFPSLKMRTGMFTLLGFFWVEVASEVADCLLGASCGAFWPPPPDWPAVWLVLFLLPAAERADESLVCVTEPSSPGLMMR